MLKIRLQRRGKKNYATYRVVVAEQNAPVKGKYIEDIGWYNPHTDEFKVEAETAKKWIENGAKPSATVNNLMVEHGVIKGKKVSAWLPKKPAEGGSASGGESEEELKAETKPEKASEEKPIEEKKE